jgi:hypothetical protein
VLINVWWWNLSKKNMFFCSDDSTVESLPNKNVRKTKVPGYTPGSVSDVSRWVINKYLSNSVNVLVSINNCRSWQNQWNRCGVVLVSIVFVAIYSLNLLKNDANAFIYCFIFQKEKEEVVLEQQVQQAT